MSEFQGHLLPRNLGTTSSGGGGGLSFDGGVQVGDILIRSGASTLGSASSNQFFWNRDAGNGILYPTTISDGVAIGTQTPVDLLGGHATLQLSGATATTGGSYSMIFQSNDLTSLSLFGGQIPADVGGVITASDGNPSKGGMLILGKSRTSADGAPLTYNAFIGFQSANAVGHVFDARINDGAGNAVALNDDNGLAIFNGNNGRFAIYGDASLYTGYTSAVHRPDAWMSFGNFNDDPVGSVRGFAMPQGNTTDRDFIDTPLDGLYFDNTETKQLERYNGDTDEWDVIGPTTISGYWSQTGNNIYPTNIANNVGVGTTTPNAYVDPLTVTYSSQFAVVQTLDPTDRGTKYRTGSFYAIVNPTSAFDGSVGALSAVAYIPDTAGDMTGGGVVGFTGRVDAADATVSYITGLSYVVSANGTQIDGQLTGISVGGTTIGGAGVTLFVGHDSFLTHSASLPLPEIVGYRSYIEADTGGSVVNIARHFYAQSPSASDLSTFGIVAGLEIDAQKVSGVTVGYGVKQNGSLDLNYFAGLSGFNKTNPYAQISGQAPALQTGTGTVTASGASITGTGTAFTTELLVGDTFIVSGGSLVSVQTITDDTHLTLSTSITASGLTFQYGRPLMLMYDYTGARVGMIKGTGKMGLGSEMNTRWWLGIADVGGGALAQFRITDYQQGGIRVVMDGDGVNPNQELWYELRSPNSAFHMSLFDNDSWRLLDVTNSRTIMTALQSNGFVGFGTTTPATPVEIINSNSVPLSISGTTAAGYTRFRMNGTGHSYDVGVGNASETTFGVADKFFVADSTGGFIRMVIDTSGNIGFGTTSPDDKVHVFGSAGSGGLVGEIIENANAAGGSYIEARSATSANVAYLANFGTSFTGTFGGTGISNAGLAALIHDNSGAAHPLLIGTQGAYPLYLGTNFSAQAPEMTITGGRVGIGTSPDASAILDVASTTQGFLPPRMTTTQKNAIASPATGLVVFDTSLAKLSVFTGAVWETVTSV